MKRAMLIVCAVMMVGASAALAAEPLKIVTGSEPGIAEGQEIYRLGMPVADFIKKFGPAEKTDGRTQVYTGEGLIVEVDKAGKVISFTVFFSDGKRSRLEGDRVVHEPMRAAKSPSTDKGVTPSSSFREIVRAHGEPVKREDIGATLYLTYAWGHFCLESGRLTKVMVAKQ